MSDSQRYLSIDLLRGASLTAMLLVSSRSPFGQLRHGTWFKVTIADLVYPSFLLLVGISMAISIDRGLARGESRRQLTQRMVRRLSSLFTIGLVLSSLAAHELRLSLGTFQSIAIASLFAFPAAFLSWPQRLVYLSVGLASATVLLHFGAETPANVWHPYGNFAERIDLLVLGKYRGVEGILGSIFSALFVVLGLVLGAWLQHESERIWLTRIALLALFGLSVGEGMTYIHSGTILPIPVVSRLISASFFLQAGSLLVSLVAIAFYLVESRSLPAFLSPIANVGANPLAIYCGVKIFQEVVLRYSIGSPPMQIAETLRYLSTSLVGAELAALTIPVVKLVVAFSLASFLFRKKLQIKI